MGHTLYEVFSIVVSASQSKRILDIIVLLILGVVLIGAFLYWQHYLETIQADPDAPFSVFTPPPLMKLSLWTRANGRFAAMMAIAFINWCAFLAWIFWVQVRRNPFPARLTGLDLTSIRG
jgi:hypothetical protein